MLNVDLVISRSRHYASRRLSAVFPFFSLNFFSRQNISARIACYKGWPACFTTIQGGTLFWNIFTTAEKDAVWVMVITEDNFRERGWGVIVINFLLLIIITLLIFGVIK
jgi:hypothetical protein